MSKDKDPSYVAGELFWSISEKLGTQGWQAVIENARAEADGDIRGTVFEIDKFRVAIDVSLGQVVMHDMQSDTFGTVPLPTPVAS